MSKEETLLPCPFCGKPGRIVKGYQLPTKKTPPYRVECSGNPYQCNGTPTTAWGEKSSVIERWNKRTEKINQDSLVLSAMDELAERGWCVVLKKMPREIGWVVGDEMAKRLFPNTWACEAQPLRQDAPLLLREFAFGETARLAVERVIAQCAEQTKRHAKETEESNAEELH